MSLNLPIGILFLILFVKVRNQSEKLEDFFKFIENKVLDFLRSNTGKAYTSEALTTRIINDIEKLSFRSYFKKNSEEILKKVVSDLDIQMNENEEEIYYFLEDK